MRGRLARERPATRQEIRLAQNRPADVPRHAAAMVDCAAQTAVAIAVRSGRRAAANGAASRPCQRALSPDLATRRAPRRRARRDRRTPSTSAPATTCWSGCIGRRPQAATRAQASVGLDVFDGGGCVIVSDCQNCRSRMASSTRSFVACLNHIPERRDALREAHPCCGLAASSS